MSLTLAEQQSKSTSAGELATSVADALHQMAQPLTILQGLLELSLLQAKTEEDFRISTEEALAQLQRAMHSLHQARTILRFTQSKPSTTPIQERNAQHV